MNVRNFETKLSLNNTMITITVLLLIQIFATNLLKPFLNKKILFMDYNIDLSVWYPLFL